MALLELHELADGGDAVPVRRLAESEEQVVTWRAKVLVR
jgi:hypothetical protein